MNMQQYLLAVEDERIVGFILVNGNNIQRKRHVATIVIGILQSITGEVLGRDCLKRLRSGQNYMMYGF